MAPRFAGEGVNGYAVAHYTVEPDTLQIFRMPELNVVKVSMPRPIAQASLHDRDVHAGQHHVPLAALRVPGGARR